MDECRKCKKPVDNSLHNENRFLLKKEYCPECQKNIGKFYKERNRDDKDAQRTADRFKSRNTHMYFNKVKRK